MRVVLLSTYTSAGGAAIAALRLLSALVAQGVDARMITLSDKSQDDRVEPATSTTRGLILRLAERAHIAASLMPNLSALWRLSTAHYGIDIARHPWIKDADVIHLHWINHGFLSLSTLRKLAQLNKPIAWTMHDLWALTGGCHLPLRITEHGATLCARFEKGCGRCPLFGEGKRLGDFTARLSREKLFLRQKPFAHISVSSLTAEIAATALGQAPQAIIAPPLDLSSYSTEPTDPAPGWYDTRSLYLTLSAARIDDPVKGHTLLIEVLKAFIEIAAREVSSCTRLILVGAIKQRHWLSQIPLPVIELGRLSPAALAELYPRTHCTLSTSVFETFGQTISESLASGVPVVAFDSIGARDLIISGKNGQLIPAYDTQAMARAIERVLLAREAGGYAPAVCRASVLRLDAPSIARRHIELYQQLIQAQ